MAGDRVGRSRLRFFPHLWVPIGRPGQVYDEIELAKYRARRAEIPDGEVDYSAALASRNNSIAAIAQRSSILMSVLSLLIGAHLVLWINVYFRPIEPMAPPMTMSTVTGHNVLIGIALLLIALLLLMTTLWFHWSTNLEDYASAQAEYHRTKQLVKWRAYRVNLALLFMFAGLAVTVAPYVPMGYSLVCTAVWELLSGP